MVGPVSDDPSDRSSRREIPLLSVDTLKMCFRIEEIWNFGKTFQFEILLKINRAFFWILWNTTGSRVPVYFFYISYIIHATYLFLLSPGNLSLNCRLIGWTLTGLLITTVFSFFFDIISPPSIWTILFEGDSPESDPNDPNPELELDEHERELEQDQSENWPLLLLFESFECPGGRIVVAPIWVILYSFGFTSALGIRHWIGISWLSIVRAYFNSRSGSTAETPPLDGISAGVNSWLSVEYAVATGVVVFFWFTVSDGRVKTYRTLFDGWRDAYRRF